ncbi:MAG: C-GCAxxG-C-C family protein [Christensenellaceae bacterium]
MSDRPQNAKENFEKGYNCTQAVVLAYAKEMGLDDETVLKIASSFGGGMGKLREVCGAVSGMFMVAGMLKGYTDITDPEAKKLHYQLIRKMGEKFKNENGSIVCKELLGLKKPETDSNPQERTPEYYKKRPCAQLVYCAAQIIEEEFNL